MKFIVGTKSEQKLKTVQDVLTNLNIQKKFTIIGFDAASGVPETPWDQETYEGAKNRALESKKIDSTADYYIGIESGLTKRYGQAYEEAWAFIIDSKEKEYIGYSSGLKVPDYIVNKVNDLQVEHWKVMKMIQEEYSLPRHDTWGNYSNKMIIREISLTEAIRNALIQVFAPEDSFYNK